MPVPVSPAAMPDALDVLRTVFGLQDFRGDQAAIVRHVVSGGDAIVLMPTGGGKSLCYQIPALCRPGLGLVVSPLIALMRNQVDILRQSGVRAAAYNSSLSDSERTEIRNALKTGALDLLYVSPERLLMPAFLEMLRALPIALIAIDEAHCVSQWGHDFRPEYLALGGLKDAFPGVPIMALTATADQDTRQDISRRLGLNDAKMFVASFDRPNIRYAIAPKAEPRRQLKTFLAGHKGESGIVYCLSRATVEATAKDLAAAGFAALPYHAGLPAEMRSRHQDRFLREDGLVLVATLAFGMGVDKPDVRFVAHLDLPGSLEAYYQETGRAGRDGAPAEALLLYGMQDVVFRRQMIDAGEAPPEVKRIERAKLEALLGVCETASCRRQAILKHFGETLAAPCGNCDTCLAPAATFDGTVAARKALSAAKRTGWRFGAGHLTDILLGAETEKIRRFGHHNLPTFGVGRELDRRGWGSVFRQLVVAGVLAPDADGYGTLGATALGEAVLRGERPVTLRRDVAPALAARPGREPAAPPDAAVAPLHAALKAERLRLAREQSVPAYVIFTDQTLAALAASRPSTSAELGRISGIGQSKLERYGAAILAVINGFGPVPA